MSEERTRYRFPRSLRILRGGDFRLVYAARRSVSHGPLRIHTLPREGATSRLGLSVPRRVGNAPRRNLVKRRLREAFRALQHDFPRGYDVVVTVAPHEPLILADYQRLLFKAMRRLHTQWTSDETKPSRASQAPGSARPSTPPPPRPDEPDPSPAS